MDGKMKIGDLVRVPKTCDMHVIRAKECNCFFCASGSNRIGVILAPAELNMWHVMFDAGEWELYEQEMELMND